MFAEEEKIQMKFFPIDVIEFEFQGNKIKLIPFFSITNKVVLIDGYIENLMDVETTIGERYIASEYALILHIVDSLTNIDINAIDVNVLTSSGLWNEIKQRIPYNEFRTELMQAIRLYLEDISFNRTAKDVLTELSKKIYIALDKITNLDSEAIKDAANIFVDELKNLNEVSPGIVKKPRRGRPRKKVE
ncbi:MAG: hypothetical protein ACTSRA_14065 [Promethearchaeota archaeon]